MKNKVSLLFMVYLFLSSLSATSQTSVNDEKTSIDIVKTGVQLYEDKKYEESIAELKKVHRNDSNYYLASLEMILSYLALNKDSTGLELCNHLLKIKNEYTPNVLKYKADFLDNLKRPEEADKVYQQGIKEYPVNHSFYYEMGVSKMRQRKYSEAYDLFVKTIKINPLHSSSHFQMGTLAYRNNNLVAALLAYQYYLLCDRTSERAKSLVNSMEKIARMEAEPDSLLSLPSFSGDNNDFSELESILKSKVALSPKYKLKVDLNYDLIKQMQLIVDNIGKYSNVKGFYNEFYGKFFSELNTRKYFEPFVYSCLSGMEVEKINKWIAKNEEDVNKYEAWGYNYICTNFASYSEDLKGVSAVVPHWFNNNKIIAAGVRTNNINEGYWNYYYSNGIKKSEGEFKKGIKEGVWKFYYPDGNIKELQELENGVEKVYKTFYLNNNPKLEVYSVNGKINGEVKTYFSNGNPEMVRNYKDGKIAGKETRYFNNSSLKYTIENTNNVYSGDFVEYFDNGNVYQKFSFSNGEINGKSQVFYNNDNNSLESEGNYSKNKLAGEWKFYHKNGKISKQGGYNSSGEKDGIWKEFYEDGKQEAEETYSEGKYNGLQKYYDYDGNLWQEYVYRKGKMQEYRAYKKDATKICDSKMNGKNFQLTLYHANSQKRREGKVNDGEMDGVWKDYSIFGVLTQETNYKEGKLDGPYKEYYQNGQISKERNFENGVENGSYKVYYVNGKIEREGKIVKGSYSGYWKFYYKDGTLKHLYYYLEGDIDGWAESYDVNGKLSREDLYSENCLVKAVYHDTTGKVLQIVDLPGGNGIIEKKSPEGKLVFRKEFYKNYVDKTETSYYPDGKIQHQVTFKKGKREGKYISYDELGRLINETSYFNDDLDGKKIFYYDNGKIESEFIFDNGEYHGKGLTYYENGKPEKTFNYLYGNAEGEADMFDEAGELIYKRTFLNDLLVNYTYKDPTGNFVKPMELKPGVSSIVCYFSNGKKSIDCSYSNGDLNGKRSIYHSTGKLASEQEFIFEAEHGTSKFYYSNGTLKAKSVYYYGDLNGLTEEFYENGKPKSEKNYKLGQKHGWFKFYDTNGKLIKSVLYYNDDPLLIS